MLCLAGSFLGLPYEKCRGYLLRLWGKFSCYILDLKLQVQGDAPDPPFILVSNHLSYLDIFVLFSQLRCLFVAKSDVKTWPLVGFIIRTCGILFIDRNRKRDIKRVNTLISKNITDHQGIIIFPEGTTSPGMKILPFKTSLLENPASMQIPVTYATIRYKTSENTGNKPAYEVMCWWDDTPFMVHFFNFLKLKQSEAFIRFGKEYVQEGDRKILAQNIYSRMTEQFEPVVEEAEFQKKHGPFEPLAI
ncbi:MAG: lysophospholipid acyltransferase family protein [Gracilimonas sp.]|nr:lysophospholipid acyltransferase family protein [Gracilimonas sp.]